MSENLHPQIWGLFHFPLLQPPGDSRVKDQVILSQCPGDFEPIPRWFCTHPQVILCQSPLLNYFNMSSQVIQKVITSHPMVIWSQIKSPKGHLMTSQSHPIVIPRYSHDHSKSSQDHLKVTPSDIDWIKLIPL